MPFQNIHIRGTLMEPNQQIADLFKNHQTWPPEAITPQEIEILRNVTVVMETSKGKIKIKVYPDAAPIHSANFVKLARDGFYNGLTFHRVIKGFMSQGGDPEGTGSGGPGYDLPAEIKLPHETGSVAAARLGDQVNPKRKSSGSQFYICHSRGGVAHLDNQYTVFGKVIDGQDVNLALNIPDGDVEPDTINKAWVE
jgi:cyclophilin family peptidyl-prolyl cis-trans isomerase